MLARDDPPGRTASRRRCRLKDPGNLEAPAACQRNRVKPKLNPSQRQRCRRVANRDGACPPRRPRPPARTRSYSSISSSALPATSGRPPSATAFPAVTVALIVSIASTASGTRTRLRGSSSSCVSTQTAPARRSPPGRRFARRLRDHREKRLAQLRGPRRLAPHGERLRECLLDDGVREQEGAGGPSLLSRIKNNKTKNYEFVQNLKKKFCLLLTATPIQNRISEIFNLVSLLKPGHLGSETDFYNKYKKDSRSLDDDQYLKELVNKVMIRNRRADTGIEWTKRIVETISIEFSEKERELYDAVSSFGQGNAIMNKSQFSCLTLQREACSSRESVYYTLKNMLQKEENDSQAFHQQIGQLISLVEAVDTNSKAEKALELIKEINDKVIIFTEYRATQVYLQWFLKQHGITSVPFRGGFKRGKKDWMRELFKNNAQVLIATEAGGEGINLQFCSHIINYDLPWNPMRLEQRIGRIHRLGQEKDVKIYNFAIKGTVEEHVMKLLYEKIHLFEKVIGELDDILTKLEFGNIEEHLVDIFNYSSSEGEMKIKMDNLTSMIQFAEDLKGENQHAAAGNS